MHHTCNRALPRAKKGLHFKEDDRALPLYVLLLYGIHLVIHVLLPVGEPLPPAVPPHVPLLAPLMVVLLSAH